MFSGTYKNVKNVWWRAGERKKIKNWERETLWLQTSDQVLMHSLHTLTHTFEHMKHIHTQNKEAQQRGVKPPEEDAALEAFINSSDNSCF